MNWYYSGTDSSWGETVYYSSVGTAWADSSINDDFAEARDKVPLTVPPTVDKSLFFANEVLRDQWQSARFELSKANDVYIVGYSMPETDMLVRFLLSELDRGVQVHLINRLGRDDVLSDDEVVGALVERYRTVLPVDKINVDATHVHVGSEVLPDFARAYARSPDKRDNAPE